MIDQLRAQISRFRQIILKQEGYAKKSNEDHAKMLEAIKNRDEVMARQGMEEHLAYVELQINQLNESETQEN